MPAAAVIPALQACTNAVAVKKLVVEFLGRDSCCVGVGGNSHSTPTSQTFMAVRRVLFTEMHVTLPTFTLKKLECSKQALRLNTLAWSNGIGLWSYFVGFFDRSND